MDKITEQITYINQHLSDISHYKSLLKIIEVKGSDARTLVSMQYYFDTVEKQLLEQLDQFATLKLVKKDESNEQV